MEKNRIDRFIQKYNLNGNAEQVTWNFKDKSLTTKFIIDDKSLLGTVSMQNVDFDNMDIGVYDTAQLQKLLNVLSDDINLDVVRAGDKAVSLKVKNNKLSVNFNLSDLSIIPAPPTMKHIPDFGTHIELNKEFVDAFIRGKNALADTETFTLVNGRNGLEVIIGYAAINTNRVNIPVTTTKNNLEEHISFNADLFKEVLVANKECTSAVLEISNEGLARVNFKVDDYDATYYIVAAQELE